jgi:hypothetical protein
MAALTSPITGNGTTVSGLGQTTFVKKVSGINDKLGNFDISTLATTGYKEVKKTDLADTVTAVVECYHIGNAISLGTAGTFTITWPSAGTFIGTGYISDIKYPDAENGSAMMMSYTITFDGLTGPAYTAA